MADKYGRYGLIILKNIKKPIRQWLTGLMQSIAFTQLCVY
ncbi:Uncharacterized protein YR821_1833 [Yersinia ruckeri]|uniref:Uncharacterized protein n=1 Tax=Yersinia ruckeri TaxID=29486 RepID=A0A0A8VI54_YERRU|nr:hypothetical protein yruck0001_13580 [Yersinia ruckeri ATCC 29473]QTD76754.1 Uncharacterized protein YR821_1833 [Yersinia ruckeri]CEK27654.1 hypothetical protein CSF007_9505 [Yersinia ruckeri]